MPLPDFVGIGAQKAGSTWLYSTLSAHPRIWTTPKKEIHYFDKSPDWRDPKIEIMKRKRMGRSRLEVWYWYRKYSRLPRDDRWYASLFRPGWRQIAGEITPDYYVMDEVRISKFHEILPDAKLLFVMRNPIERAWSHAVMDLRRGENKDAHKMSIEELSEFFERGYVARRAYYLDALKNWTRFYPQEQIFTGFMEDIHFHPFKLLRRIYRFLGVDPNFRPPGMRRKVNSRSSGFMRVEAARYLARSYYDELQRLSDRFGGYADFWLYCADRLLNGAFEKEDKVPYPLWTSSVWKEWRSRCGHPDKEQQSPAKPQSGLLSNWA